MMRHHWWLGSDDGSDSIYIYIYDGSVQGVSVPVLSSEDGTGKENRKNNGNVL